MSILTKKFQFAKDSLQTVRIEISYEGKAYYQAFVEDWDEKYLVIKYLDTTDTSSVVERTILIQDITEFMVVRPINLEESYLQSDPKSSPFLSTLLFAEGNPGDESDNVMEEIFYQMGNGQEEIDNEEGDYINNGGNNGLDGTEGFYGGVEWGGENMGDEDGDEPMFA